MLLCLCHSEISQSFISQLLKIKPLYQFCKTHAPIWSWSAQTQCLSSQPISLCVQSHTTHYFVNVYYLAISFQLSTGHNQSIAQEHECIQNLSTMRQKMSHFTVKMCLNYIPIIFNAKWDILHLMVLSFWMHSCYCTMAWLCPVLSWKLIAR